MLQRLKGNGQLDDIVAVEQRADVRVIVNVPGRYTLGSKRDARGERRVFACKALNMSARAVALLGPVMGPLGDRVTATIDHFGKLSGVIIRLLDRGFVMSIAGSDDDRMRLSTKLIWFDQYKNYDVEDGRKHGRIVPQNPCSTVIFADGHTLTCLVIDMSVSGAAVSADTIPPLGTVVAIGRVVGRVVRLFEAGFAVQFVELENPQTLEQRLIVT